MLNRQEFIKKYFIPIKSGYCKVVFPDDLLGYNSLPNVSYDYTKWGKKEWEYADHAIDLLNEKYREDHPAWIERFMDQLKSHPHAWAEQSFRVRSYAGNEKIFSEDCFFPHFVVAILHHTEIHEETCFYVKYGYDRKFGAPIPYLVWRQIEKIIFDEVKRGSR